MNQNSPSPVRSPLQLIPVAMPMSAPLVTRNLVVWPWRLTLAERQRVEAETSREHLGRDFLDKVLDFRTEGQHATKGKRR
jgi:hypothetical protein